MRLSQLTVLVFGIQLLSFFGCATTTKEARIEEMPLPTTATPSTSSEPVGDWTSEYGKALREKYYRMIQDSTEDLEAYLLLKLTSKILHTEGEMVALRERVLQNLEAAIVIAPYGQPGLENDVKKFREQELEAKKRYSDLAMVYNKKMRDTDFKFSEPTSLPGDETETLPRFFPIR